MSAHPFTPRGDHLRYDEEQVELYMSLLLVFQTLLAVPFMILCMEAAAQQREEEEAQQAPPLPGPLEKPANGTDGTRVPPLSLPPPNGAGDVEAPDAPPADERSSDPADALTDGSSVVVMTADDPSPPPSPSNSHSSFVDKLPPAPPPHGRRHSARDSLRDSLAVRAIQRWARPSLRRLMPRCRGILPGVAPPHSQRVERRGRNPRRIGRPAAAREGCHSRPGGPLPRGAAATCGEEGAPSSAHRPHSLSGPRARLPTSPRVSAPHSGVCASPPIDPQVLLALAFNPNMYASVLGVVFSVLAHQYDFTLKDVKIVDAFTGMLRSTLSGIALVALGLFTFDQKKVVSCTPQHLAWALALRFLVAPLGMVAVCHMLALTGELRRLMITQATLPQAVVAFAFSEQYRVMPQIMSSSIVVGTLLGSPVAVVYYYVLEAVYND